MSENFYTALLAIVVIPYSFIFLLLVWNILGPSIQARRARDSE